MVYRAHISIMNDAGRVGLLVLWRYAVDCRYV